MSVLAIKKMLLSLLVLALWIPPLPAEERPCVVLALSGGGIKGFAHVGVLQVLEEQGVGVAGIVGTSMGAIIGGVYASGCSPSELESLIRQVNLGKLVTETPRRFFQPLANNAEDTTAFRPELHTDRNNNVVGPLGLFSGVGVLEYLANHLSHVTVTDFSQLPIPFAAVATDLESGEKVVLRRGNLASAIRASMSLPGVFDPWYVDGRLLVDGGLVSNMPVDTAKELFPGYPVIAVNLTSEMLPRSSLTGVVDVLSQSITILTMQNVRREAARADLVISPGVREYPILGTADTAQIIAQGRRAAEAALPQIRALLQRAPKCPPRGDQPQERPIVRGVVIAGVPNDLARRLEKNLGSRWVGSPIVMGEVIDESARFMSRSDVRTVDYDLLERPDGVVVSYRIQRYPPHRYTLGGYGSTMSHNSWLTIQGDSYDLFDEGDVLRGELYLSETWGGVVDYSWSGSDSDWGAWHLRLLASQYKMEPQGAGMLKWLRTSAVLQRHIMVGERIMVTAGFDYSYFARISGEGSTSYFSPMVSAAFNFMDSVDDPKEGLRLSVSAYWPTGADELMVRADAQGLMSLGKRDALEFRGGFTAGNSRESRVTAAYLGAREELYSLASHPIPAESFAWWRFSFIHTLQTTFLGNPALELFGGQGFAWDNDGSQIDDPWEIGLALTTPRKLLNSKLYAVYGDQEEWRFGVSIGTAGWDTFLPY